MSNDPVKLEVSLKYASVAEFDARFAANVAEHTVFLRTPNPKAAGTRVHLVLRLSSGQVALSGGGPVLSSFARGQAPPGRQAGMIVGFTPADADSAQRIKDIVAKHGPGKHAVPPVGTSSAPKSASSEVELSLGAEIDRALGPSSAVSPPTAAAAPPPLPPKATSPAPSSPPSSSAVAPTSPAESVVSATPAETEEEGIGGWADELESALGAAFGDEALSALPSPPAASKSSPQTSAPPATPPVAQAAPPVTQAEPPVTQAEPPVEQAVPIPSSERVDAASPVEESSEAPQAVVEWLGDEGREIKPAFKPASPISSPVVVKTPKRDVMQGDYSPLDSAPPQAMPLAQPVATQPAADPEDDGDFSTPLVTDIALNSWFDKKAQAEQSAESEQIAETGQSTEHGVEADESPGTAPQSEAEVTEPVRVQRNVQRALGSRVDMGLAAGVILGALIGGAIVIGSSEPEHVQQFRKANQMVRDGKAQQAVPIYTKILAEHPDFALAQRHLGVAFAQMGQARQARAALSIYVGTGDNFADIERVQNLLGEGDAVEAGFP